MKIDEVTVLDEAETRSGLTKAQIKQAGKYNLKKWIALVDAKREAGANLDLPDDYRNYANLFARFISMGKEKLLDIEELDNIVRDVGIAAKRGKIGGFGSNRFLADKIANGFDIVMAAKKDGLDFDSTDDEDAEDGLLDFVQTKLGKGEEWLAKIEDELRKDLKAIPRIEFTRDIQSEPLEDTVYVFNRPGVDKDFALYKDGVWRDLEERPLAPIHTKQVNKAHKKGQFVFVDYNNLEQYQ